MLMDSLLAADLAAEAFDFLIVLVVDGLVIGGGFNLLAADLAFARAAAVHCVFTWNTRDNNNK